MSAIFHLAVDHDTVGPVFEEMRTRYDGPAVISQDLTTFDITAQAIVVRQRILDPMAWAVIGATKVTGPPMSAPHELARLVGRHAHHGMTGRLTAAPIGVGVR